MELGELRGAGATGSWSNRELELRGAEDGAWRATGSWSYGELELPRTMEISREPKLWGAGAAGSWSVKHRSYQELELRGAGATGSRSDEDTRKLSCRRYVARAQEGHVNRRLLKMVSKW
jgi:hypothetical protein